LFNKNIKTHLNKIANLKRLRRIFLRPLKKRKKIIFIENTKYFQHFKNNKSKFKKKKVIKSLKFLMFYKNSNLKINKTKNFFIWEKKNIAKKNKKKINKRYYKILYINLIKMQKQLNKNVKYFQIEEISKQNFIQKLKIIERI
jgi:hypothetical protein